MSIPADDNISLEYAVMSFDLVRAESVAYLLMLASYISLMICCGLKMLFKKKSEETSKGQDRLFWLCVLVLAFIFFGILYRLLA